MAYWLVQRSPFVYKTRRRAGVLFRSSVVSFPSKRTVPFRLQLDGSGFVVLGSVHRLRGSDFNRVCGREMVQPTNRFLPALVVGLPLDSYRDWSFHGGSHNALGSAFHRRTISFNHYLQLGDVGGPPVSDAFLGSRIGFPSHALAYQVHSVDLPPLYFGGAARPFVAAPAVCSVRPKGLEIFKLVVGIVRGSGQADCGPFVGRRAVDDFPPLATGSFVEQFDIDVWQWTARLLFKHCRLFSDHGGLGAAGRVPVATQFQFPNRTEKHR